MSGWSLECQVCGKTFEVPPDKAPPDELPRDRAVLGMAVPQHGKPEDLEEMCEGSGDPATPKKSN